MTVSALFSRCPLPSAQQLATLTPSKKQAKKRNGQSLKQNVLAAVHLFYHALEDVRETMNVDWGRAGFGKAEMADRKAGFSRASFRELVVSVFTLLSDVSGVFFPILQNTEIPFGGWG